MGAGDFTPLVPDHSLFIQYHKSIQIANEKTFTHAFAHDGVPIAPCVRRQRELGSLVYNPQPPSGSYRHH
jgi:hypothetical protein